jgi:predicted RNA-binding Zn-ribbon protein involved in translation (DUF1610 family)
MATFPTFDSSEPLPLEFYWQEFVRLRPTEQACVEYLRKSLNMKGNCPSCTNEISVKVDGARFFKCPSCSKKQWLTARTFFHRSRKVRPWLGAIFLLERGVPFNAYQFHKLAGIAYSTAFSILKKITVALQHAMEENSTVSVSSSHFVEIFGKRSRETPVRKRPVCEQEEIDNGSATNAIENQRGAIAPDALKETSEPTIEDPVERAIYKCLSFKPLPYDAICERLGLAAGDVSAALTLLELSSLVSRLPGDQYVRSLATANAAAGNQSLSEPSHKTLVREIADYIRTKFGAVSRKYLQNYISIHWWQSTREKKQENALLTLCLRFRSVKHYEIREYVSPPLVQVALADS